MVAGRRPVASYEFEAALVDRRHRRRRRACSARSASDASRRATGGFISTARRSRCLARSIRIGIREEECRPPTPGISRTALSQRQGDGPQHAALPRQDSRQALFRARRPARARRLARHALLRVPDAGGARDRPTKYFIAASPSTRAIPRSASGPCSTKAGASTSTTIPTIVAGSANSSTRRRPPFPARSSSTTRPASRATIMSRPTSRIFIGTTAFPHQNAAFAATTTRRSRAAPRFAWSPHGDAARARRRTAYLFGVRRLGPAASRRHPGAGRRASPGGSRAATIGTSAPPIPHGVETRFRDAGLAATFGDLDGFVDAAQEFQFRALKAQIETLRWEPAISGYVITELNDVQWEANGLMDARNNPRRFADRLGELANALARHRPRATERRSPPASASKFELRLAGPGDVPAGARIAWRFGGATARSPPARRRQRSPSSRPRARASARRSRT